MKEKNSIQVEQQKNANNKFQNQKPSTGNIVSDLLFQLQKPSIYKNDGDESAALRKFRKKKRKGFRL